MKDLETDPDVRLWNDVRYKTILPASATGGAMSIVDSLSPPLSGPPRHIHHDADETFVMLTGACRVWIAGEERLAGPGESVFIPRGTEHTFQVTAEGPSRHLVILTPGGFEGFFEEMAQGAFRIPDDMPAIVEAAARHHLTFTGPPLEPSP
ncbi:cupin domain-containing protein [Pseudoruegeria sp. SHC-113]|uniref:cupin domain-containing protein n=1 Tax=Pseudoruegeria sp. SHC-113 TaxID=2855439 RepID=UPI0021BB7F50|nr:cupin domain-containing protein [Pseudoruegeria sp. SHC-113]MCT8159005.1 cupin domain-containing protein [Pseudoruegeria sp. SHC-113]